MSRSVAEMEGIIIYIYGEREMYICIETEREMPLGGSFIQDVILVEFKYLVFTRMPGESYRRRLLFVVEFV